MPDARALDDRQRVDRLVRLQQAQEVERAVEHADVRVGGDDDRPAAVRAHRADQIAFGARRGCSRLADPAPRSASRSLACRRRRRRPARMLAASGSSPEQAAQPASELVASRARRRRVTGDEQRGDRAWYCARSSARRRHGVIAQPQLVAVLAARSGGNREQCDNEQADAGALAPHEGMIRPALHRRGPALADRGCPARCGSPGPSPRGRRDSSPCRRSGSSAGTFCVTCPVAAHSVPRCSVTTKSDRAERDDVVAHRGVEDAALAVAAAPSAAARRGRCRCWRDPSTRSPARSCSCPVRAAARRARRPGASRPCGSPRVIGCVASRTVT